MTTIRELGRKRFAEGNLLDLRKEEDMDWVKDNFPAIGSDRAIGMSEEYQFMPTHKMASVLAEDFGMVISEMGQQWSRARDPAGQEHFVKFRMPEAMGIRLQNVGDSVPELIVMNSHNGRSTIRAYAGIFRMVCSNGMVVADRSFGNLKLRHFGEKNSYRNFQELLNALAKGMAVLDGRLKAMSEKFLTPHEQNQLAKMLMEIRGVPDWLEAKDVLEAVRVEDDRNEDGTRSIWTTFNVLQENLTNRAIGRQFDDRRDASIRPLSGARAHILQNERIWSGLETFVEQHFPAIAELSFEKKAAAPVVPVAPVPDAEIVPEPIAEEPAGDQGNESDTGNRADAQPETASIATVETRSFEELMKLATYGEVTEVSAVELEALDRDQRAKLAKRKSYLKGKEKVNVEA